MNIVNLTVGSLLTVLQQNSHTRQQRLYEKAHKLLEDVAWELNWVGNEKAVLTTTEAPILLEAFAMALQEARNPTVSSVKEDGLVRIHHVSANPVHYIYLPEKALLLRREYISGKSEYSVYFSHPDNTDPQEIQRLPQEKIYYLLPMPQQ